MAGAVYTGECVDASHMTLCSGANVLGPAFKRVTSEVTGVFNQEEQLPVWCLPWSVSQLSLHQLQVVVH